MNNITEEFKNNEKERERNTTVLVIFVPCSVDERTWQNF